MNRHSNPHTLPHTHTLCHPKPPPSCHSYQLHFLCLSITGSLHANHSASVSGCLSVHHCFPPFFLYNSVSSLSHPIMSYLGPICRDVSKQTHGCLFVMFQQESVITVLTLHERRSFSSTLFLFTGFFGYNRMYLKKIYVYYNHTAIVLSIE